MIRDVQIHYTFDNREVNHLLESKGYYLCNGYTYSRLIHTVVEIFTNDYLFMDCENHTLITDDEDDTPNGEIEYTIFNIIAFYTETNLHSLKEEEIVSDIFKVNDAIVCVQIHNLATDDKYKYYLKVEKWLMPIDRRY